MFILPPKAVRYTKDRSTQPVFAAAKSGSIMGLKRKKSAAEAHSRHYNFSEITRAELAAIMRSGEVEDLDTLAVEIDTATTMVDNEKFDFIQYLKGRIAFCEQQGQPAANLQRLLAKLEQLQGQARQPSVDAYV